MFLAVYLKLLFERAVLTVFTCLLIKLLYLVYKDDEVICSMC